MRFVVNLTSPNVDTSLKGGNFRGEPRWERQATEALLEAGHTVHTIAMGAWSPIETKPPNLIYGISPELAKESVCLAHDFQPDSVPPIFKASIFNMFSIHYFRDMPERVQHYKDTYGRKLIFTQGYLGSENEKAIINAAGADYYEFLGVPGVPSVVPGDNFNKKKLLWISRGVHLHAFPEKENPELILFINWVKAQMTADPELEFYIVSGLSQRDMDWQGWACTVEERIFQSKIIQELNCFRDRVKVPVDLDWSEVLELMKDVKLSVSIAPDRWGGPPCEAAAFGIPYLQPPAPAMFEHMSGGYLHANNIQDKLAIYSRLMSDHSFYRQKGDEHRSFVEEHHTYTAFNKRLHQILAARGIV